MFVKWSVGRTAFAVLVGVTLLAQSSKRPITHQDYDAWKAIGGQRLSDDGKWLAYTLTPQEGDGEMVLKNLETNAERRFSIGSRPPAASSTDGEPAEPTGAPPARSVPISFTTDNGHLVFTTMPAKAETDAARKAKKRPEEMPKGALMVVPLAGGEPLRIAAVRSFQLAENAPQWIAYSKEPAAVRERSGEEGKEAKDQGRSRSTAAASAGGPRREFGSELVLLNLSDKREQKFADVAEYSLPKDGKQIVYAVASRKEENNGIYAAATDGSESKALLAGKGRYQRLTWDEKQTQLAFLSNRDDAAARNSKSKLYLWPRGANAADAVVDGATAGVRTNWTIAERGTLTFSKDGKRVFFATAPARVDRRPQEADPSEEKVVADLWHWKDPNVQPMQKIRAEQDRNRSYRAVYHIDEKRAVQLADTTMADLTLNEDSTVGIGSDDREYKPMVEFDERHVDYYLVNVATGARSLVARNQRGSLAASPDGKFGVLFNGRDWLCIELGTGRTRNLTESMGVQFFNEEYDMPGTRPAYGLGGWTKDSKHILINDRYDIWQFSPDGAIGKTITDGMGRRDKIQFRVVRMGDDAPVFSGRGGGGGMVGAVDSTKPLLLRAENMETRDTGFYEDRLDTDGAPRKLIMGAKSFSTPAKAKKADVLVLTASRFDEFGDLQVTDAAFQKMRKVSDANPQKAQQLWGTAELMTYRNLDGTPLKAVLYKPENFDPNKKYPMVVYIYERLTQSLHTFRPPGPGTSINIGYYVSNGYLVLTPDIAYTTGYPGQSALKCVIPAIDAVVGKGIVKEDAIGIQGHSWGGYQIAYMVTQTNRFKAAAAGAPVANMTSAYDGIRWGSGLPRQFQYERSQSRIGGSLWQYPLRFLENSPIFQADRVRTPLLMLHNDQDDAVPWYQGIEYFLALRRLNREVYLFNYNGEPHGLRKRINQKDYTMRMQQFFDHHLKGAPKPEWMERGIPYIEREQEKENWKQEKRPLPTGGGQ